MAASKEKSAFSMEAAKQAQINFSYNVAKADNTAPSKQNKEKLNITLYPEYKNRLKAEADRRHVSISQLIQLWIDELGI